MRIKAFCSFTFLESLTKESVVDLLTFADEDIPVARIKLFNLVKNGLVLMTDATTEKIQSTSEGNPLVKFLIKNQAISPATDLFSEFNTDQSKFLKKNDKFLGLFLFSTFYSDQMVNQFQNHSGNHCINKIGDAAPLFEQNIEYFSSRDIKEWDFASKILTPHNSLVIADPYLFNNNIEGFLNFLLKVIPSVECSYHLTLISSDAKGKVNTNSSTFKANLDKIKNLVCKKNPLAIVEHVIYNGPDFHDRYLISNNSLVFSGSGLDIINIRGAISKESIWFSVKLFDRSILNGNEGVYYFEVVKKLLDKFKKWSQSTIEGNLKNPLFKNFEYLN